MTVRKSTTKKGASPKPKPEEKPTESVKDSPTETSKAEEKVGDEQVKPEDTTEGKIIDSEGGATESVLDVLKIPVEDKTPEESGETAEDVLEGMGGEPAPEFEGSGGSDDGGSDFGMDSELYEDHALMAEIGVEMIDMLFTYGAQAIAGDFEDERKYSVSQARKNRIKQPLEMLLKKRETGVSPEIMVAFMVLVTYSPIMITAVKKRNEKRKAEKAKKGKGKVVNMPPQPMQVPVQEGYRTPPQQEKGYAGRPSGTTDSKPRTKRTKQEKKDAQILAYNMKKKGATYEEIKEKFDIAMSTAQNWVKAGEELTKNNA